MSSGHSQGQEVGRIRVPQPVLGRSLSALPPLLRSGSLEQLLIFVGQPLVSWNCGEQFEKASWRKNTTSVSQRAGTLLYYILNS